MAEANCPACERPAPARINGYCPSCWVAGRDAEAEKKEHDAARAREADKIVRTVARGAFVCWSGDRQRTECLHCNAEIAMPADKTVHATGCAYARARAYVEGK